MASKKKTPAKAGSRAGSKASAKAPPGQPATASSAPSAGTSPTNTPVGSGLSSDTPKAPRTRRPPVPSRELVRPDPDQPPADVGLGRTSVYSEWLNQTPQAPGWLNSPPPRKPSPTARRRAAAKAAEATEPPDPMQQVLNDQPAPPAPPDDVLAASASRPTPRRRTTARRITQGERLAVTSAELEAVVMGNSSRAAVTASPRSVELRPPVARQFGAAASSAANVWSAPQPSMAASSVAMPTQRTTAPPPVMAGMGTTGHPGALGSRPGRLSTPDGRSVSGVPVASGAQGAGNTGVPNPSDPRASGRYPTAPQPPATLGQTAGRIPSTAGQSGAQLPVTRQSMRPATHSGTTGTDARLAAVPGATDPPATRTAVDSEAVLIRGARRPPVTTTGPVAPRRKGPHPVLAQLLVALGTIIILLITVTLTSPLGYGAALSGTFQAYAQPFIMVPTPTPTPSPTPMPYTGGTSVNPGTQVVINDINAIFGQYAPGALNVARCESGFDPNARNPYAVGNSHAEGVFQILFPSTWDGTSYRAQSPYNYDANIHAAYEIFSRDGYSWREWQCQP